MEGLWKVGVDIGSTTIKYVVLNDAGGVHCKKYFRHFSEIQKALESVFQELRSIFGEKLFQLAVTGSAGMGIAQMMSIPFVQEVVACARAVRTLIPQTDVAVEIGGEDAKITYFGTTPEQRMNGVCAGGTGAFIDQMASLLGTDAAGLNDLASKSKQIYPIASRCGVFAKTDLQALINDGVEKNDIAVSIFQAVANQVVGTLSQGRPIQGNTAFLGGPLHFLPELKKRFIETLALKKEQVVELIDGCYFVAIGAALYAESDFNCAAFERRLQDERKSVGKNDMEPLFSSAEEYRSFVCRHENARIARFPLADYAGKAYLGIDAGSTTTKIALIGEQKELLYSYYGGNKGQALTSVREALLDLYAKLNDRTKIACCGVTGYGEQIVKAAFNADFGEVETVAHLRAAQIFCPDVDFVLDIGGQDMKSFFVRAGVIDNIMLNEACSAGCGSFIENFAQGLQMSVQDFAAKGIRAKRPVDLGTRCTVFMNSRVKQAQKEGATVADISAGIAISVVKNALFKVIHLHDTTAIGQNVVVQGGTFCNDAVLRALEKILGRNVVRPDIAALMGAYGVAVLGLERCQKERSSILGRQELKEFSSKTMHYRCRGCGNQCLITSQKFSNGKTYGTGNRCERGVGKTPLHAQLPNAYQFKRTLLAAYKPQADDDAKRGVIGLPRVLNLYEEYPFWFTFFTKLGYKVVVSSRSSAKLHQKGMDTIPSDSLCYPAKLAHGHIADLVEKGVRKIFYPCLPHNDEEKDVVSDNTYNCPIVASYPENIRSNMEILKEKNVKFLQPFLPMKNKKRLVIRLWECLRGERIAMGEIEMAVREAERAQAKYKQALRDFGDRVVGQMEEKDWQGVVLAGRPYHVDEEINHGLDSLLTASGLVVLTEDTLCHKGASQTLGAVNQWSFHARLYQAAEYANHNPRLSVIQLSSFGCGLDAVTVPQMKRIVEGAGNIYTMIRLDEVSNLGAVRIRIRSLLAALAARRNAPKAPTRISFAPPAALRARFTLEAKRRDVILAPQLAPYQFPLVVHTLNKYGYRVEIPPITGKKEIDIGLKYVNQDICYPAVILVGQMIAALQSGAYDLERTAVMLFQSGGACRATNYLQLMNEALHDAGFGNVPVFACWGKDTDAFEITLPCMIDVIKSLIYGDLLMRLSQRVRPYELKKGETNALRAAWEKRCMAEISRGSYLKFCRTIGKIVDAFAAVPTRGFGQKPKVGIVGEILVKYHPVGNNHIVDVLEAEGMEVVLPDLIDFISYMAYDGKVNYRLLDGTFRESAKAELFIKLLEFYRYPVYRTLKRCGRFLTVKSIRAIAELAKKHVSLGNLAGEGWFLTGEMIRYITEGIDNIICLQPFGCLPNHIVGKGMIRELLRSYPDANIVAIDCDAGASEVNQLNRIKLMAAIAKEKQKLKHMA